MSEPKHSNFKMKRLMSSQNAVLYCVLAWHGSSHFTSIHVLQ